jgi:hypothetical protein
MHIGSLLAQSSALIFKPFLEDQLEVAETRTTKAPKDGPTGAALNTLLQLASSAHIDITAITRNVFSFLSPATGIRQRSSCVPDARPRATTAVLRRSEALELVSRQRRCDSENFY